MRRYSVRQIRRTLKKYTLKQTEWALGREWGLTLVEVEDAYGLLDRMIAQEDRLQSVERFPYWAEIWPASLALARWFCREEPLPPVSWTVELGCGIGLVGIALARLGWRVEATDFVEDALLFAAYNAQLNNVGGHHRVGYLDWRHPVGEAVECLVGADVVYERKNHPLLLRLLHQRLLPGGTFYLSDPGRPAAGHFVQALREQGCEYRLDRLRQPWNSMDCQIDIHIFRKPDL